MGTIVAILTTTNIVFSNSHFFFALFRYAAQRSFSFSATGIGTQAANMPPLSLLRTIGLQCVGQARSRTWHGITWCLGAAQDSY